MTSKTEPRLNLCEPRTVSCEGFRIDNTAGVAIENCLNEGVHPKRLWRLLWVPLGLSCLLGGFLRGRPARDNRLQGVADFSSWILRRLCPKVKWLPYKFRPGS
jgi:hypothetical protein